MAHKFGNEYKEEQPKINVFDNKLGKEIIERIKTSQYLEQRILNELEDHKELKAVRRRINNIKNTLEIESYSIVLNDILEQTFDTPINCENCEIALVEFSIDGVVNINETNNIIKFRDIKSHKWDYHTIPVGCYSRKALQDYFIKKRMGLAPGGSYYGIQEGALFVFTPYSDKTKIKIRNGIEIDFDAPNSFGKVIGFSGVRGSSTKIEEQISHQPINLFLIVF